MADQNNHKASNFWFGFSLGATAAVCVSYLLGTKKGRERLTKILELSENLPEVIQEFLENNANNKKSKDAFSKLENLEMIIKKIKKKST